MYKLINEIFGLISKFETRLLLHSWEEDGTTGFMKHPAFSSLNENYQGFRQCIEFLFSGMYGSIRIKNTKLMKLKFTQHDRSPLKSLGKLKN